MKNTVESNSGTVEVDGFFGKFTYDLSNDSDDLVFDKRAKTINSLWAIPYFIVQEYSKGNLSNEEFSRQICRYEEYLKNYIKNDKYNKNRSPILRNNEAKT